MNICEITVFIIIYKTVFILIENTKLIKHIVMLMLAVWMASYISDGEVSHVHKCF